MKFYIRAVAVKHVWSRAMFCYLLVAVDRVSLGAFHAALPDVDRIQFPLWVPSSDAGRDA